MMIIDYDALDATKRHFYMSNSIAPRPIAWICTQNDGTLNIAPFSYFIPLGSNPPLLIISIGTNKNGDDKDTLKNLKKHKKCTINMPLVKHQKQVDLTGNALDYNTSEAKTYDIQAKTINPDFPPIVKGDHTAFFCNFYDVLKIKDSVNPTIVEIKSQYINEDITGKKELFGVENLGRIGRDYLDTEFIKNSK